LIALFSYDWIDALFVLQPSRHAGAGGMFFAAVQLRKEKNTPAAISAILVTVCNAQKSKRTKSKATDGGQTEVRRTSDRASANVDPS
jgi:hypothetical protein